MQDTKRETRRLFIDENEEAQSVGAYHRYKLYSAEGGHVADVACYEQHPDEDGERSQKDADPTAWEHAQMLALAPLVPALVEALRQFRISHDEDADELRRDAGFNDPSGGCDCALCTEADGVLARINGEG